MPRFHVRNNSGGTFLSVEAYICSIQSKTKINNNKKKHTRKEKKSKKKEINIIYSLGEDSNIAYSPISYCCAVFQRVSFGKIFPYCVISVCGPPLYCSWERNRQACKFKLRRNWEGGIRGQQKHIQTHTVSMKRDVWDEVIHTLHQTALEHGRSHTHWTSPVPQPLSSISELQKFVSFPRPTLRKEATYSKAKTNSIFSSLIYIDIK